MITSVNLENFRSLEDTGEIPIKKLTILLGKNSVGKSSFLRSFPLFQQSLLNNRTEPLLWYTPDLVDFGSFKDTKRDGTSENTAIHFSFNIKANVRPHFRGRPSSIRAIQKHRKFLENQVSSTSQSEKINNLLVDLEEIFKKRDDISINFELNLHEYYAEYVINVLGSSMVIHHEYKDNNKYKNNVRIDGKTYYDVSVPEIKNNEIIPDLGFNDSHNNDNLFVDNTSAGRSRQCFLDMIKGTANPDDLRDTEKIDFLQNSELQICLSKSEFKQFNDKLVELGDIFLDEGNEYFDQEEDTLWLPDIKQVALAQKIISDSIQFETAYHLYLLSNLSNLIRLINSEFRDFYSNMSYSTPVRANAERSYRNQSLSVNLVDADGKNVPTILLNLQENKRDKFSEWQKWTRKNLNVVFQVENENNFSSISVKSADEESFHNLADTGFGYSQMLPIILNIWLSMQNSTRNTNPFNFSHWQNINLLEQPELHLHPAMQASLMHTLNKVLADDNNSMNMMIETHSEYMTKQLGVDIARNIISPDDVQILVFDESDGKSIVKTSKYAKNGTLMDWPLGFFQPNYYSESEFQ